MHRIKFSLLLFILISLQLNAQRIDPYQPDKNAPRQIPGMQLAWHDEFDKNGAPDSANWGYEKGFVRNNELQWYRPENATCINGVLLIEGRKEHTPNPNYKEGSTNWKQNRPFIEYSSASLKTQGRQQFLYGRFEIRAKIDTSKGSWPAIWTLGINGGWPLCGETDIMEFYRNKDDKPIILANTAWGRTANGNGPVWNSPRFLLGDFLTKDPDWPKKFHVWRMDWDKDSICLYLDEQLLNKTLLDKTLNPDGSNPFIGQPQYILLNLALGANGGDPSGSNFPVKYEVDYVRYYKRTE